MMISIVIVWCVKCQKEVENFENDLLKSVLLDGGWMDNCILIRMLSSL